MDEKWGYHHDYGNPHNFATFLSPWLLSPQRHGRLCANLEIWKCRETSGANYRCGTVATIQKSKNLQDQIAEICQFPLHLETSNIGFTMLCAKSFLKNENNIE